MEYMMTSWLSEAVLPRYSFVERLEVIRGRHVGRNKPVKVHLSPSESGHTMGLQCLPEAEIRQTS